MRSYTMSRRQFLASSAAGACLFSRFAWSQADNPHFKVDEYDRQRIVSVANAALHAPPKTIVSVPTGRKALGPDIYFSENVEWFATDKGFEYRPGRINHAAFSQHRDLLAQMNGIVAACVAAWRLTSDLRYAHHAMLHLRAWFIDPATRMTPGLDHAACIPPSTAGDYRGVEDTVMLAETVRAASFLCSYNGIATEDEVKGLREWFSNLSTWLNESKPGILARDEKNRTAICWTLQAAEMARFTRNEAMQLDCSHRFRDKLLREMNFDGQFPLELHRPDAFAASIFTVECLSVLCEVLSTPMDSLWSFNLQDGRGMRSAVAFLFPSLEDRGRWPYPADPEHFHDWPVRPASLLLAGRAYSLPEYITLWKRLPAEPAQPEMLRYLPMREPALWTVRAPA